jgi:hypothetical protein
MFHAAKVYKIKNPAALETRPVPAAGGTGAKFKSFAESLLKRAGF